jgi:hydrogenase expression/formation protein HypE
MQERYSLGKLPAEHLARLFAQYLATDERVIVGPGIGHDAAVISFSDRYLVAKTDPITFATDDIGWYAVHVNANDVACTGATARWFLATLLLPQSDTDEALVDEIFEQMADTCQQLGITLVGGHTEITHGFDRPIVAGFMLGEVAPEALVRPDGARPGDTLLLTKGIAVEGTALIAREKGDQLTSVDRSLVERSGRFLYEPGISVVRDAAVATAAGEVHAMHDPTEGGLATGLWELADAAQVGLTMDQDAIPILPETTTLCEALGLNPLGLIASGALLIVAPPDDAVEIQTALEGQNIPAARIGQVVKRDEGVKLHSPEGTRPLPRFDQDEITRLFE